MLPPDSSAIVDIFEEPQRPAKLVFDYEVFNCINAYTETVTQEQLDSVAEIGIEGECGCECPPNSGFWVQIVCPDPIGTNATCDGTNVECIGG